MKYLALFCAFVALFTVLGYSTAYAFDTVSRGKIIDELEEQANSDTYLNTSISTAWKPSFSVGTEFGVDDTIIRRTNVFESFLWAFTRTFSLSIDYTALTVRDIIITIGEFIDYIVPFNILFA